MKFGAVVELEYRIIHKNGEIHWINELMQTQWMSREI
jgi:hypothetical protein